MEHNHGGDVSAQSQFRGLGWGRFGILPTTEGHGHTIREDVSLFIRNRGLSKGALGRSAKTGSPARARLGNVLRASGLCPGL